MTQLIKIKRYIIKTGFVHWMHNLDSSTNIGRWYLEADVVSSEIISKD